MKVLFKGKELDLIGNQLKKGDTFPNFKAVNLDMSEFDSKQLSGQRRLIFSIPTIDSSVCEIETTKFMNKFMKKPYPVVAISYDLPFAYKRWCSIRNNNRVITLSEFRYNDFSSKTGTKIDELGLLTRAVFVVDENDKIEYVDYVKEISNEPNYDEILEHFK
ncbi:thiol peroxidase [[Mycoplasma] phocae]|uniref:Thiol peroxidase n=1 Tax=[Mycoplasma] phocae TaxID=142651 RepID=A0A2Z5IPL4_9BACT|nr:thiol peroxidase [[Mycoplasma] phocae]AXE60643.1 thiol peroxidase [[Mycoplasma] phocae]